MVISVIIIILWMVLGIIAILVDREIEVNWLMLLFIVIFPFFPFIFHWCGLF